MKTTKPEDKGKTIEQEVQQILEAAKEIGASQKSARDFLISTGIYNADGQINPAFR